MYWNNSDILLQSILVMININMRCIEIMLQGTVNIQQTRLTLTWDVLKFLVVCHMTSMKSRLTLTWDVLKWHNVIMTMRISSWLTLTWDVLKFFKKLLAFWCFLININMRCIEMTNYRDLCYAKWININMRCIEI